MLGQSVYFHEYRTKIKSRGGLRLSSAYNASDLLMMPNIPATGDMEGFGVVILEANEARTSMIASDLEGLQDGAQWRYCEPS
ncbi:glycosyltransferase [Acaryochloris sp. IP29b_bin.148]|uniref:glycosyltransferase n=1 Tax=Acaryochloris sp. IP29b_bin.148 TaxID=2969218 RepID=UPI0026125241|nr:glycosyltransferase [Acaryochloris sp. IP29b_bin.148]